MTPVSIERTGWRDEKLSARHREWGWDCPAIDIDFLMIEYDQGKAVALVEYKNENAAPQYASHPSYRALIDLGNRAGIPVFNARYANDLTWFKVTPLNAGALAKMPGQVTMSELEWVTFLYQLRERSCPAHILTQLQG